MAKTQIAKAITKTKIAEPGKVGGYRPRPEPGTDTHKPAARKLRKQEKEFVEGYLQCGSIVKAGRMAGFRSVHAAYDLWRDPAVARELAQRHGELMARLGVTTDRVIAERAAIAFFDPRTIFDDDGSILPIKEWPDNAAAALASMDIEEATEVRGLVRKIRLNPKGPELDALMKHLGLFEADNKQKGDAEGAAVGKRLAEAVAALDAKIGVDARP
jgi:phage terminase small subunit